MSRDRIRKVAAVAGMTGPLLFALVVLTLSIIEYPFMRSLGWDPVLRPTFDWPSGLALGPLGWVMIVTFILSGAMLSLFAWGLRMELRDLSGQISTVMLVWSGVALMGLAFPTDRTLSAMPVTWHGRLHDLSFLALGLMLIPAMVLCGLSFRGSGRWRRLSLFTWITSALAIPTFAVRGIVFYLFLAAMLVWNEVVAFHLWE